MLTLNIDMDEGTKIGTMPILTAAQLLQAIRAQFPWTATCWSQATDESRELCRAAREALGLDESHAIDFRKINDPAVWNRTGAEGVIRYYGDMTDAQKAGYLTTVAEWFPYIFLPFITFQEQA